MNSLSNSQFRSFHSKYPNPTLLRRQNKGKFLIDLLHNAPQRRFTGFWTNLKICSHWVRLKVAPSFWFLNINMPFFLKPFSSCLRKMWFKFLSGSPSKCWPISMRMPGMYCYRKKRFFEKNLKMAGDPNFLRRHRSLPRFPSLKASSMSIFERCSCWGSHFPQFSLISSHSDTCNWIRRFNCKCLSGWRWEWIVENVHLLQENLPVWERHIPIIDVSLDINPKQLDKCHRLFYL